MKNIFIGLGLLLVFSGKAQESSVDTIAVMIIDRMASVVGELNSCSFTLEAGYDVKDPDYGFVKKFEVSEVHFAGPDKLHVDTRGDKGHRGFWYNGLNAIVYSFDENNYAIMETPDNTIDMIDTIHAKYGIEFPAADFFYPTFTDDLLVFFEDVVFAGKRTLNGQECWLVIASNTEMSAQIWFSADAFTLPQRFVIVYKSDGNRQYEAVFSNWKLNQDIPGAVFDFLPPPRAREVSILPRTSR